MAHRAVTTNSDSFAGPNDTNSPMKWVKCLKTTQITSNLPAKGHLTMQLRSHSVQWRVANHRDADSHVTHLCHFAEIDNSNMLSTHYENSREKIVERD